MELRLKVTKTIIASLVLCFLACNQNGNIHNQNNLLENNDWAKDTLGCLHLRTKDLALKLIRQYKLTHNTEKQFIEVLGQPNKVEDSHGLGILEYYTDNICENGKSVPNSDICYVSFYFKSNEFIEMHFSCE